MERFGQINCCQKLLKVAQSTINRQIWLHWSLVKALILLYLWLFELKEVLTLFPPSTHKKLDCFESRYCKNSLAFGWMEKGSSVKTVSLISTAERVNFNCVGTRIFQQDSIETNFFNNPFPRPPFSWSNWGKGKN